MFFDCIALRGILDWRVFSLVFLQMNSELGRIYCYWTCSKAHRLHLAIRRACEAQGVAYMYNFETFINGISMLYTSYGHKRAQHIQKIAEEMGFSLVPFHHIFAATRWISSELSSVSRIRRNYKVFLKLFSRLTYSLVKPKDTESVYQLWNYLSLRSTVILHHQSWEIFGVQPLATQPNQLWTG